MFNKPVFQDSDFTKPLIRTANASGIALGGVLNHETPV